MRNGTTGRTWRGVALAASGLFAIAGCGSDGGIIVGPGGTDLQPGNFDARYEWVLHGWQPGGLDPVGHAGVVLTWTLPADWDREPFRVYARRSVSSDYVAISTITSCADDICSYTDLNVSPGQSYDYFVATVDERTDEEFESEAVAVQVPSAALPQTPGSPEVTALDDALYLTWQSTGAARYRIFLERIGTSEEFVEIGETDGTSFVDERAENGVEYGYRIAAIDPIGQFSRRSAIGSGIPRPDYHTELVWSHLDDPSASGFRFQSSDDLDPIYGGLDAQAQWRLDESNGVLTIVPNSGTLVTAGYFTTALTCGPAADADCISVATAPAASEFGSGAVEVAAGNTYVFQVTGDDGSKHYGKIRVQGSSVDTSGSTVLLFDWAYQLLPNEPSLSVGR